MMGLEYSSGILLVWNPFSLRRCKNSGSSKQVIVIDVQHVLVSDVIEE